MTTLLHRRQALALLAALATGRAGAATWPTQPVRLLLPFASGGASDLVARVLADKLGPALGQPWVVESRPGANGIIATDAVAKAAPDGHTLLLVNAAHAINSTLYPRLPYDSTRDLQPVALVVPPGPFVLAVHPSVPARSLAELLDLARRQPGQLAYASAGIGNALHLAGEMLAQQAGVKLLHVPYKGAGPALNDLLGGQVQLMFNAWAAVAPHVQAGRLRVLGQTGLRRAAGLPADLPTLAESGLPAYQFGSWFGLLAPARTPAEVVARLNAECQRALAAADARDRLAALGSSEPAAMSPSAFGDFLQAETTRLAAVIRAANLQLDVPRN